MNTLILGLGNPILSDDGIGIRIIEVLENYGLAQHMHLSRGSFAGMELLDMLSGFKRAIIIDAIKSDNLKPGTVQECGISDLKTADNCQLLHCLNLSQLIKVGKALGLHLPDEVLLVAIAAMDVNSYSTSLTPEVEASIPRAITAVLKQLVTWGYGVREPEAPAVRR